MRKREKHKDFLGTISKIYYCSEATKILLFLVFLFRELRRGPDVKFIAPIKPGMMRRVVLKKLWRVQRSDQGNFPDVKSIVSHKKAMKNHYWFRREEKKEEKIIIRITAPVRESVCLFCVEKNSQLANVIPKKLIMALLVPYKKQRFYFI